MNDLSGDKPLTHNFEVATWWTSLLTTILIFGIFVITFFSYNIFAKPGQSYFYQEYLDAYGNPVPSQRFAFAVSAVTFAILLGLNIPGKLSERTTKRKARRTSLLRFKGQDWPTAVRWEISPGIAQIFTRILRMSLYVCVAAFAFLCATRFAMVFWRFYLSGNDLSASDPHVFTVFAKVAEEITRQESSTITSAYGFLLPAACAAIKRLSGTCDYRDTIRIAIAFNVFFVILGALCLYFARQNISKVFAALMLNLLLIGPFLRLAGLDPALTYYANLSGYRYIPFVLVVLASSAVHSIPFIWKVIICAALSVLSIFISQDTGTVATIGFLGIVVLHEKLSLQSVTRAGAFLVAFTVCLTAYDLLLLTTLHVDLIGSLLASVRAGTQGFANLPIKFADVTWAAAALNIASLTFYITIAWRRRLFPSEQGALLLAGMIFIWIYYYMYRPADVYWIFHFGAFVLFALIWPDILKTKSLPLALTVVLLVGTIAAYAVYNEITFYYYIERAPSDAPSYEGIHTDATWDSMIKKRKAATAAFDLDRPDVLSISALPFAALQLAPKALIPQETVFELSNPAALQNFVHRMCLKLPRLLVYDGPDMLSFEGEISNATTKRVQNAFSKMYERNASDAVVSVFTLKDGKAAPCQIVR